MKRLPDIAIFDLDGCLFDDEHRLPLINMSLEGDARYEAYHADQHVDLVLEAGVSYLKKAAEQNLLVVFLTARPIKYFEVTLSKLGRHFHKLLDGRFPLHMRPDGDKRTSVEFKRSKVREIIAKAKDEGREVVVAFDDRQDVVDMYREEGVPAWVLDKSGSACPGFLRDSRQLLEHQGYMASLTDGPAQPKLERPPTRKPDAGDLMAAMARTFKERNAVYGNNAEVVGRVMAALFPHGVKLKTPKDFELWHLLELVIVKLTRFTQSELTHEDSIHDLAIYAAMVELLVKDHNIEVIKA